MQYEWLEKVHLTESVDDSIHITWSSHFSSRKQDCNFEVGLSALLPLLRDQAHDVATVKHAMDKIQEAITFLNPNQSPVMTADQPLFALAKQIQWSWPEKYGHFVIILGGLHIEMATLKMMGNLLQRSGWTAAIQHSGIATAGTADSFLHAACVTKTRMVHQVTACTLYKLLKAAFEDDTSGDDISFEQWCITKSAQQPTFKFWFMILELQLIYFAFVFSFREGDFEIYKATIAQILPFLFANDSVHYSRWLTVHINDMLCLEETNKDVHKEFSDGNFVLHESQRQFSSIALDQAHEHNNALVKGDGGAIGITENPSALLRWMTSGPEVCQLVKEYDVSSNTKPNGTRHHEDYPSAQKKFFNEVEALTESFIELGNPFLEESNELLALDSKHVSGSKTLYDFKQRGQEQFESFRQIPKQLYAPIKRNNFTVFDRPNTKQNQVSTGKKLKKDCSLFSNLFIICQTRKLNLNDFFAHENQSYPPSISKDGELYDTLKSDIINELEKFVETSDCQPQADALILDGSVLVYSNQTTKGTFEEYSHTFDMQIDEFAQRHSRVDVIFDQYKPNSLKAHARKKRGTGQRMKVTNNGHVPTNWKAFLRDNENKTELFSMLAKSIYNIDNGVVYATINNSSVCNKIARNSITCNHEEADTRIFIHLKHAIEMDLVKTTCILSNDSDIVIIAVSYFDHFKLLGLEKLWVSFGPGKRRRWIPIHDLSTHLGPDESKGLLFLHAFSGCDTVSGFRGKGKKSILQTWKMFPQITQIFAKLSRFPVTIEDTDI